MNAYECTLTWIRWLQTTALVRPSDIVYRLNFSYLSCEESEHHLLMWGWGWNFNLWLPMNSVWCAWNRFTLCRTTGKSNHMKDIRGICHFPGSRSHRPWCKNQTSNHRSLPYLPENEIAAFALHTTMGFTSSRCAIILREIDTLAETMANAWGLMVLLFWSTYRMYVLAPQGRVSLLHEHRLKMHRLH